MVNINCRLWEHGLRHQWKPEEFAAKINEKGGTSRLIVECRKITKQIKASTKSSTLPIELYNNTAKRLLENDIRQCQSLTTAYTADAHKEEAFDSPVLADGTSNRVAESVLPLFYSLGSSAQPDAGLTEQQFGNLSLPLAVTVLPLELRPQQDTKVTAKCTLRTCGKLEVWSIL